MGTWRTLVMGSKEENFKFHSMSKIFGFVASKKIIVGINIGL
jgi:hypothetical protein